MSSFLGAIRLVVIDSPYDSLAGAPEAQDLFMRALLLKLNSYRNVYPYGVMPADTYDFLSTHHIVGFQQGEIFRPLMVYRMITAEKCERHNVPFPGLLALRGPGDERHVEILGNYLNEWKEKKESVSFGSSWAIMPELRADRELRDFLKEMMTAMLVHHETESGSKHMLAAGMLGVHTDAYFKDIGYSVLESGGEPLPSFHHASLMGAEALLMYANEFNIKAYSLAEKYRRYWESRRVFSAAPSSHFEKKRAA